MWKRWFPILSLGIRSKFKKVQSIIVATAVLHNTCCINNEFELLILTNDIQNAVDFALSVPICETDNHTNNSVRRALINNYWKINL